ncbi:copper resistance system multicopper oxidase [Pseudoxanthomonas winnipegensis]|uniref:Copper resistance system multicopper oxidase n=1 Tax=Pseudoxanthomonas winnipegensis TaxID=2480810 RepID=A0A4Q8L7M3_9GAMM|nr:copper resistance system multicopper oxidase [Pseudoxanthomonas winnipegensis]TAA08944.1 copper resistance system multicopper oxidase [Pseudoxanthomonas winnipegensis]TAA20643.1 copper resistance system multicopper oxidase [Pseudoxanthomonas winnipegensis]TAA23586.1 copper resistance system multicopper oxidase [Pseudoxanthomonas winnipegensis]TAH71704.1 copper resistance system multicopper oxidase [Pseudoxanthomonas winnipegensis]
MKSLYPPPMDLSRRRFVHGLALGGTVAALGLLRPSKAWALASAGQPATLSGTDFALDISETMVNYTGRPRVATTVNGGIPGPTLRWKEGTTVTLRVTNRLRVPTSIHWHGIILPFREDGVPGISFPGIAPGETFTYRFPVRQSGTYWYHSHSRFQEQTGLYGSLVIDPAGPERNPSDRDYVVMLNDWSDASPEHIFATLKRQSDYYNFAQPTAPEFFRDVRDRGLRQALAERKMWNQMRMNPTDLSDVSGYTYTYLMNGTAPAGNWTGLFKPGEKVRLRFINGSAMTIFDVRIPGLKMTVISADGQDVAPVPVDEFRISVAETYDVLVEPQEDRAFTIFAQSIDRTGYARGTLAPRIGMEATVPAMDPRMPVSMVDMMGAMAQGSAGHGDMQGMSGMTGMQDMPGMDMSGMAAAAAPVVRHARTEYHNPGVDMHVDMPRTNLDDPGTGLRDNGRRVLTYADLHTLGGSIDKREPSREIELHLTGNMERYMWSFDGVKFSDATPVHFRSGERLRVVLVNDTMMNHPIHLHGMWSELESPDGKFQVRKHTINVQPAQRITYGVSADNLGRWAYHCHMLYHMEAGMFREVVVS